MDISLRNLYTACLQCREPIVSASGRLVFVLAEEEQGMLSFK